jgi:CRP/FNR family transcriptional regulator
VDLIMIPLTLMENGWWNTAAGMSHFYLPHQIWRGLEVIDNIAFRAGRTLGVYLKRHSDACGCEDLKLSHQEIARAKHPREVVSRLLKMEQRGMVKLHRNHIELLN